MVSVKNMEFFSSEWLKMDIFSCTKDKILNRTKKMKKKAIRSMRIAFFVV